MLFQGFSKYEKTALEHALQLAPEAQKSVMEPNLEAEIHPRSSFWRPRALRRPQLGDPERSKDPNLEVQSPSENRNWRPRALQELNLGSQAPKRALLGAPKPFRVPNLEGQSAPRPQFGGSTRFQDADQSIRGTEPSDD